MKKIYITTLLLFTIILSGCGSDTEVKSLTYLESIENFFGYFMILEDKEEKAYYSVEINNYLYDNIGIEKDSIVNVEVKRTIRNKNAITLSASAKAKIEELDDKWRYIHITNDYTKDE